MTDGRKNLDLSQTDQVFRSSSGSFAIFADVAQRAESVTVTSLSTSTLML